MSYGRLTSLSHHTSGAQAILLGQTNVSNIVVIDFPSPPDFVELARRANYDVVSVFTTPDGFHQYQFTEPLKIPVEFSLHSQSPDCPRGGLTLLDMAAKLHALTLPIGKQGERLLPPAPAPDEPNQEAKATQAAQPQTAEVRGIRGNEQSNISFPVACKLDLIWMGDNAPGIRCVGYVEEVRVKLHGPMLRGPNGEINVPMAADFHFTFVHRPTHTNSGRGIFEAGHTQAFADDVKKTLYNSVGLIKNAPGITFQGFNE